MNKLLIIGLTALAGISYGQTLELVADIDPTGSTTIQEMTPYNGNLYFRAANANDGFELWMTDGTMSGTEMVKDIFPGANSGYPRYFRVLNGALIFTATGSSSNQELWISDGTESGTIVLKDINPSGSSEVNFMHLFDGKLYFQATNGIDGKELWVTDGTPAGTSMFKDINTSGSSAPTEFYNFDGKMYFQATNGVSGKELWVSDGTPLGTQLLKDISSVVEGNPVRFIEFQNKLFFVARDDGLNFELWVTDGTSLGTVLFKDINNSTGSFADGLFVFQDNLYFRADDGLNAFELWVSDGTPAGTQLVKNIKTVGESFPDNFTAYNGKLFFTARDDNGKFLYTTDGTTQGTIPVPNVTAQNPYSLSTYNGRFYFVGDDGTNGSELWQLTFEDDIYSSEKIAPPIAPNPSPCLGSDEFVAFNGSLYFQAHYTSAEQELWKLTTEPLTTGINDVLSPESLVIAPNPFQDVLKLNAEIMIDEVIIRDILGAIVFQSESNSKEIDLDLSELNSGYYFLHAKTNEGQLIRKIQKMD